MLTDEVETTDGWRHRRLTEPRGLAGANGIRFGPDGKLYAVSALGGQVGRVDVDSGDLTIVSAPGGGIVSPDDLAFGQEGVIYVSDYMENRVCAYDEGRIRVVAEGIRLANGICTFQDRIFVNEFRVGGRLLEVFPDGRPPIVVAENLGGPNGMTVGPDRMIYLVQVFEGDVLRIPIDGGPAERLVGDLAVPTSARVGPDGSVFVSQPKGEVIRVDPRSREQSMVVRTRRGIDNLDIDGAGRVFLSYYSDGAIVEVAAEDEVREVLAPGLVGPYGLAATEATVLVADGIRLVSLRGDGVVELVSDRLDPGFPGFIQDLAPCSPDVYVSTSGGRVIRYDYSESHVLAEGLSELKGVAVRPDGALIAAEAGEGRLLAVDGDGVAVVADGLERPVGVALADDRACFVTDEARGQLIRIPRDGSREILLDGLDHPQGLAVAGSEVYVVEAGAKRLHACPTAGGEAREIARGLPVGRTGGGVRDPLPGVREAAPRRVPLGGPIGPFAGLAAGADGRLYVGGDEKGIVVVLERTAE